MFWIMSRDVVRELWGCEARLGVLWGYSGDYLGVFWGLFQRDLDPQTRITKSTPRLRPVGFLK